MKRFIPGLITALILLVSVNDAHPQSIEPDILPAEQPRNPLQSDIRNGAMFSLMVTNYGFGVGGQYRRVLSPMTEGVVELQITALKDSREQTFFTFWGQQIVPGKYNRALSFPLMAGVRQRFFANYIDDSLRLYLQVMGGPAMTFVYPYFEDVPFIEEFFPNAIGHDGLPLGVRFSDRQLNDVFQGWGDGSIEWGYAGKIALNIDFSRTFRNLTTLEFGVQMFYYPQGIQMMEPNSVTVATGFPVAPETIMSREIGGGFSAEDFFISPTITLMFGGMW